MMEGLLANAVMWQWVIERKRERELRREVSSGQVKMCSIDSGIPTRLQ